MDQSDILFLVTSQLTNSHLTKLDGVSHSLRHILSSLVRNQLWWMRRVEHLLACKLAVADGNWKLVYSSIWQHGSTFIYNHDYTSTLLVSVLLQAGSNPMEYYGRCLSNACHADNIEAVKLLLADPRIDMDDMADHCLDYAIENENREMVRLLLDDARADPRACLHDAVRTGDIEIVRMLLLDGRAQTGSIEDSESYSCLYTAIECGFIEIAHLLLGCKRVSRDDIEAFELACSREQDMERASLGARCRAMYLDIAGQLLLASARPREIYTLKSMLLRACKFGSIELVCMLLSISGLDPSHSNNRALMLARRYERHNVVRLLLLDDRVAVLDKKH